MSMQLALVTGGGRRALQAVQDHSDFPHRLAWTEQRTSPSPSPSPSPSFSTSIGGRAASRVKPTPGLCSNGPVEKPLYPEWRGGGGSSAGEVEKSKPQPAGPPQQNSSMELITEQYLCGQWPRELHPAQRTCMTDKATQTPGFWSDDLEGLTVHKRSASWSSADHREEIAKLCVQLQRSVLGIHRNKEPESPSLSLCSQVQIKLHPASSTSMGVPKPTVCRVSSYNDSINRELESVFLSDTWRQQERDAQSDMMELKRKLLGAADPREQLIKVSGMIQNPHTLSHVELQDGRCAPVPPHQHSDHHTQSTDAQLFSNGHHSPHLFPSAADLPHATEPFTNRPGFGEGCDYANESSSPLPPLASSPKPNNSFIFKRVPPEGCEKIKVFEETLSKGFPVFSCPDRNKVSFIPTGSGPFCPVRQPSSSFFPSDCWPDSQSGQLVGHFKQAGGQESPPSHCFSSYRTLHC